MSFFIVKWLIAWIKQGRLVYLLDHEGREYLTIAYKSRVDGKWRAEVWWPWDIRKVTLLEDGQIGNGSYIQQYKWYKELK